jgi:hypothetical protein
MQRVLVVYECVPESASLYLLNVDEEEFSKIIKCHGPYLNVCDNPAEEECSWLSNFLEREKLLCGNPVTRVNRYVQ